MFLDWGDKLEGGGGISVFEEEEVGIGGGFIHGKGGVWGLGGINNNRKDLFERK